jgi:hypothetical protein
MSTHVRRRIGGLALVGGAVALRPGTAANRAVHHGIRATGRRLRYVGGQLRGAAYRLSGGHPDPHVSDDVLADRIRSSLGTLEKRLDLPHIHVMVEDHVALLHGDVATDADVHELVSAVRRISGVSRVDSRLHVGLTPGDTRPSEG